MMAHSPWNKSHCYDPTAKAALDIIDKQRIKPKSKYKPKIAEPINRIGRQLNSYTKKKLYRLTDDQKGK